MSKSAVKFKADIDKAIKSSLQSEFVKGITDKILEGFKKSLIISKGIKEALEFIPKPQQEIIDHVVSCGWTIPSFTFSDFYSDEDILQLSKAEIDEQMYQLYMEDDKYLLLETIDFILEEIDPKFKTIIKSCFDLFETEHYRVAIPSLIPIIEGELSNLANFKDAFSFRPKIKKFLGYEEMEQKGVKEGGLISIYSLAFYIDEVLFKKNDFSREFGNINRHRVLHGWDDPNNWTKIDVIRLFHTILTIQMVKYDIADE
ncbi:hypothetical protein [Siminovitchia terrae]|uniref:hypothetical protein n=1 Tax=Siminovitchia terrae TaxID=1914933 RepID=UPI0028AE709F|nr:hypothetical protein [Siminovitchia terrae]